MDKQSRRTCCSDAEISSIEWEFINMSEQEEDLIYRMYKLVGNRWGLIAGRIPGRNAEEIERFWIMTHGDVFAHRRMQRQQKKLLWSENSKPSHPPTTPASFENWS